MGQMMPFKDFILIFYEKRGAQARIRSRESKAAGR
jgi:hypothetical protein